MIIQQYTEEWKTTFELIREELTKSICNFIKIEHVGSTAIPGMYAKPIIDIDIEVENELSFGKLKSELESIGYKYCGNQGIKDREVFKRTEENNNEILDKVLHHLYVCPTYSNEYDKHIRFRNYLRNHLEFVEKYNEIKQEILKRHGENNREKYVEIKENEYKWFFEEVVELSRNEENHPTTRST